MEPPVARRQYLCSCPGAVKGAWSTTCAPHEGGALYYSGTLSACAFERMSEQACKRFGETLACRLLRHLSVQHAVSELCAQPLACMAVVRVTVAQHRGARCVLGHAAATRRKQCVAVPCAYLQVHAIWRAGKRQRVVQLHSAKALRIAILNSDGQDFLENPLLLSLQSHRSSDPAKHVHLCVMSSWLSDVPVARTAQARAAHCHTGHCRWASLPASTQPRLQPKDMHLVDALDS